MASPQLSLLLLAFLVVLISPSHLTAANGNSNFSVSSSFANYPRVELSLYYETLCPFCANFIVRSLAKVVQTDLRNIVSLKLVPWGNAVLDSDGKTILCQHGSDECILNTIEACALNIWPIDLHYKLIYCIEYLSLDGKHNEWESCFAKMGLPSGNSIVDCYNSGHGRQLDFQYGKETVTLNPPHQYVPWVLVNQQPLRQDYNNFLTYVCNAYEGPVPDACKHPMLSINSSEKVRRTNQVCFADDHAKNTTHWAPPKRIKSHQKPRGRARFTWKLDRLNVEASEVLSLRIDAPLKKYIWCNRQVWHSNPGLMTIVSIALHSEI